MEWLARGTQVLIALGGAYLIAFWFVLTIWTFRDIETRSRSVVAQIFATLMVVLFFVPGVLLYLILRPKETLDEAFQRSLEEEYLLQDLEELPLCPTCHRYVNDDFILCPHCHAQLREPCAGCERLVDLRWALCAYCGMVQHGRAGTELQVGLPETRWSDPDRRRKRPAAAVTPVSPAQPRPRPPAESEVEPASAALTSAPAPSEVHTGQAAQPAFSMVNGMKSIVRPFDRFRMRDAATGTLNMSGDEGQSETPAPLRPGQTNGHRDQGSTADGHRLYPVENRDIERERTERVSASLPGNDAPHPPVAVPGTLEWRQRGRRRERERPNQRPRA